jgi:hypothetical protein
MMMPKGHGNRLEKPRSPKQHAHARKVTESIVVQPYDAGLPTESWWARPTTSREEFDRTVSAESQRMKISRFGRSSSGLLVEG